jgi:hypothetical protein
LSTLRAASSRWLRVDLPDRRQPLEGAADELAGLVSDRPDGVGPTTVATKPGTTASTMT